MDQSSFSNEDGASNPAPLEGSVVSPSSHSSGKSKSFFPKFKLAFSGKKIFPLISTLVLTIALPVLVLTLINSRTFFFNKAASGEPTSRPPATECQMCGGIANIQCASGLTCQMAQKQTYPDQSGICVKQYGGSQCGSQTSTPLCKTGVNSWSAGSTCTLSSGGSGLTSAKYQCYGSATWYTATLNRCATIDELVAISSKFCASHTTCQGPTPIPSCVPRPVCPAGAACVLQPPPPGTVYCSSPKPTPTCVPRPSCLDSVPRCLIPVTSDMCLRPTATSISRTATPYPYTPVPSSFSTPIPITPLPTLIATAIPTSIVRATTTPLPSRLTFITTSLPSGRVRALYSAKISGSDTILNSGLIMNVTGLPRGVVNIGCTTGSRYPSSTITCYLQGTPTTWGFYRVRATLTNYLGGFVSKTFNLWISPF